MSKCQVCHMSEATWAMQYIGEDTPTFTLLGNHYRGFTVVKVCDDCKETEQSILGNTAPGDVAQIEIDRRAGGYDADTNPPNFEINW